MVGIISTSVGIVQASIMRDKLIYWNSASFNNERLGWRMRLFEFSRILRQDLEFSNSFEGKKDSKHPHLHFDSPP